MDFHALVFLYGIETVPARTSDTVVMVCTDATVLLTKEHTWQDSSLHSLGLRELKSLDVFFLHGIWSTCTL